MPKGTTYRIDLGGKPQPKQVEFLTAKERYICFGGARGGGKSWVVDYKAVTLALKRAGIKILILRRSYSDLRDNHINRLRAAIPQALCTYRELEHAFIFANGSRIRCGYFASDSDALQYQGQEYDCIFIDEATQFGETVFDVLKACVRGANNFPKHIFLTANPGGVGHAWVKRLFIDREFRDKENPDDYRFIKSTVDDNFILCERDPDYVKQLDALPPDLRAKWRYGDWDVVEGQYFSEFNREKHVIEPYSVPAEWRRYVSIDYGLDRLAALWHAVDGDGNDIVYREYCESDLTISAAAKAINERSEGENIYAVLAPPDLWNRSQETGKSKATLFEEAGLRLTKSNNDREAGWLAIKELLADRGGVPRLRFFDTCREVIKCLPLLMRDPIHPTDCANEPHEITHAPDSLRYFSIYWITPPKAEEKRVRYSRDMLEDYYAARTEEERQELIKLFGGKPIED